MITVNLTEEQAGVLYDLVGDEFRNLANAYCVHTPEHVENQNMAYSAMCAIRTARESDFYDREIYNEDNPFLISKKDYLLEQCYLSEEDLVQQGIVK